MWEKSVKLRLPQIESAPAARISTILIYISTYGKEKWGELEGEAGERREQIRTQGVFQRCRHERRAKDVRQIVPRLHYDHVLWRRHGEELLDLPSRSPTNPLTPPPSPSLLEKTELNPKWNLSLRRSQNLSHNSFSLNCNSLLLKKNPNSKSVLNPDQKLASPILSCQDGPLKGIRVVFDHKTDCTISHSFSYNCNSSQLKNRRNSQSLLNPVPQSTVASPNTQLPRRTSFALARFLSNKCPECNASQPQCWWGCRQTPEFKHPDWAATATFCNTVMRLPANVGVEIQFRRQVNIVILRGTEREGKRELSWVSGDQSWDT